MNRKFNKGISAIEILIVVAIIAVSLIILLGVVTYSLKISSSVEDTVKANSLAQEEIEAVRNFRDGTDWNTDGLRDYVPASSVSSGPYYLELDNNFSPPKWRIVSGTETIDGFSRSVLFEKVSRDGEGNIEETYNPANDDPNARKITAIVSWGDKEVKLVTYLTNWK